MSIHDHQCGPDCQQAVMRWPVLAAELRPGDMTRWGPVTGAPDIWPNGRVYVPIKGAGANNMRGFGPKERVPVRRLPVGYEPGQRVKFHAESLGVLLAPEDAKFVGTLGRDFVGILDGLHPSDRLPEWMLVTVPLRAVEPGDDDCAELIQRVAMTEGRDARLWVPVHPSQIEPIPS